MSGGLGSATPNTIEGLDPAHLRRFSLVLEVPIPPIEVRRRLLQRAVGGRPVSFAWIDKTAANPHVAPAHVERVATVVRLAEVTDGEGVERTVSRVIAQALPKSPSTGGAPMAVGMYDLAPVRADVDLERLVAALARHPVGTVCLHGPLGTGKTAFAHHLAEHIGLPLSAQRASDLLDKYVGETEKRIARRFGTARQDRCVLLIDEADSLLRTPADAQRSWEVTQVNAKSRAVGFLASARLSSCAAAARKVRAVCWRRRGGFRTSTSLPKPPIHTRSSTVS